MRLGVTSMLACVGIVSVSVAAESNAAILRHNLHIPRQTLDVALKDLAQQTGLQIVRFSDAVKGDAMVGPLNGNYSAEQALRELLAPTGLTYRPLNDRAYIVVTTQELTQKSGAATTSPERLSLPNVSPQSLQVTQAEPSVVGGGGTPAESNASGNSPSNSVRSLEEIIVTAQKVEERLRDIPMSITAMTSRDLQALGATQFVDFANTVPSLNFTSSGVGQTQVNLRGITSGYNVSPTVGIYVDDVPYGSSTAFVVGAQLALDVGLFDMTRVEILRGPQGTLYGASTMGGLVKYVTNMPDTTAYGGTVRANVSGTQDGGVGYDASSAVNIPLVDDKAALRVGGFYTHNGGYVNNLARNDKDVDAADMYGGRVDFLFAPTDRLSVRLTAFAQDIDRDGSIAADFDRSTGVPIDGKLDQRRQMPETFEQSFRLASATVKYSFDFATLTSISSYQTVSSDAITDFSALYVPAFGGPGVFSAVGLARNADTDKFTQELRLSGTGSVVDWLIGGFYTKEDSEQFQQLQPYDPSGARSPVNLLTLTVPSKYEEYAAFGNLTFHVTDKLDVTGGVRYAHNKQQQEQLGSGLLIGVVPVRKDSDSVPTYLANVRYRVNDNFMPYVRFATGYRPGGPNAVLNDLNGQPMALPTFDDDRLTSYEAGVKVGSADRRFNADVSVYYVDWKDIQITAIRNGLGVIANAAKARSEGLEMTLTALPMDDLTIMGTFGYTNAELAADAPDLGGVKGESLPDTPSITAALSAEYRFALSNYEAFAGGIVRYVDDRNGSFDLAQGMPQYKLPNYTAVDLRTGMNVGGTRVQLYCRNVTNERGQLSAITGTSVAGGPANVSILQPRTYGLSVDVSF
ncbi:TonB-dependent receptor domain-containing protein [Steroidobacter cummioxidans]|uniref:TonB-dependent receptor domain-containing protein n=1 Tax=Steroidobacter cummioxidans TaxID=1803913 RepID=UPI001379F67F|nr:TonB-dependent receptor [Steroidobacter cummioxidans]